MTQISFVPGYAKNRKSWVQNTRPRLVEVGTDEGRFAVEFPQQTDVFNPDYQVDYKTPIVDFSRFLHKSVVTRAIQIEIKSVWPGKRFQDLCISEIEVYAK